MVDNKEIKELVIQKRWGNEGRYGDDYRSLSKQIDNFIKHMEDEDSPLQWLPLYLLSSQEIADLICTYIDRSAENRLLLENLDYKGIKYNYSDLIVENPRQKREMKLILDSEPRLKDYKTLKIAELAEQINIMLVGAKYEGYRKTAGQLLRVIDTVRAEIWDEKNLFKCIGIGFLNTGYIEQFIMICERISYGSLFYFIVENNNVQDKMATLTQFEQLLIKADETIQEEVEVAKQKYKKSRDFHEEYYKAVPREMDEISIYFVQFLERQSFYNEMDIISDILVASFKDEQICQNNLCQAIEDKVEEYDETQLEQYLCNGSKVANYKQKVSDTIGIMDFAFEKGSHWASSKNVFDLKIAFQELIQCKEKYKRQTAITMMRNILFDKKPTREQLMFLDSKMIRGYFREMGLVNEYEVFVRICKQTRKMYLNCYSAINDVEAYRLIHRTCFDFLYLFGDPTYSKIIIE